MPVDNTSSATIVVQNNDKKVELKTKEVPKVLESFHEFATTMPKEAVNYHQQDKTHVFTVDNAELLSKWINHLVVSGWAKIVESRVSLKSEAKITASPLEDKTKNLKQDLNRLINQSNQAESESTQDISDETKNSFTPKL